MAWIFATARTRCKDGPSPLDLKSHVTRRAVVGSRTGTKRTCHNTSDLAEKKKGKNKKLLKKKNKGNPLTGLDQGGDGVRLVVAGLDLQSPTQHGIKRKFCNEIQWMVRTVSRAVCQESRPAFLEIAEQRLSFYCKSEMGKSYWVAVEDRVGCRIKLRPTTTKVHVHSSSISSQGHQHLFFFSGACPFLGMIELARRGTA